MDSPAGSRENKGHPPPVTGSLTRIHTEAQLLGQKLGFSGAFLAVQYLNTQIESFPETLTRQTFQALVFTAESRQFETRKQAFFLYRDIFLAMVKMAVQPGIEFSEGIIPKLQKILISSKGRKKRAAAQALGSLPIRLNPPGPIIIHPLVSYPISFQALIDEFSRQSGHRADLLSGVWQGRSLVFNLAPERKGVVKFANSCDNIPELAQEASWMTELARIRSGFGCKFRLPSPIQVRGKSLFILDSIPEHIKPQKHLHENLRAIAYFVHRDYFDYPNHLGLSEKQDSIKEIFCRNAMLLGSLTSMGIVHTALIPLFHNRVQQNRRQDQGIYLWEHGGRLDQWLESCRYPNFARSGIRDFEHLSLLENTRDLAHYIGEHLLSFILVMGSFFRNRTTEKKAKERQEDPRDTRSCFDPDLFSDLIQGVAEAYYRSVAGKKPGSILPVKKLVCSLIERMGMDEHMEERLRIADQERMSDKEFVFFLESRGVEKPEVFIRAEEEITLVTGPHLGGFNQGISVPELIEFLFTFSAMCVSDRYLSEHSLS
ncbi:SidJ-related pseudokinase [Desulfospira joergensenii]|uniref:SidJ-related pseudokinase n=1 Tax=Desulfospira joergensenii TaxID=53329 RepID=UPI0003B414A2|nr:SidJ-related pseudokinase [Desulfospira joergensenii]